MNTQEAIKAIEKMGEYEHFVDEAISKKSVLNIISQIDEPQKPVIPQFVADWIEECKEKNGYTLSDALSTYICPFDLDRWFYLDDCENENLFAQAWLFGYDIEQEQLYTVEIPNPNGTKLCLARQYDGISISKAFGARWRGVPCYQLTEFEIRKDFDWAWQAGFAKEVEDD